MANTKKLDMAGRKKKKREQRQALKKLYQGLTRKQRTELKKEPQGLKAFIVKQAKAAE
ncbi:MAG: hypothetical protein RBU30_16580 [Polyangia bacterium]|jgi:hypothetical protein|nr:hypothetical protein [Polyangia bacterium]